MEIYKKMIIQNFKKNHLAELMIKIKNYQQTENWNQKNLIKKKHGIGKILIKLNIGIKENNKRNIILFYSLNIFSEQNNIYNYNYFTIL